MGPGFSDCIVKMHLTDPTLAVVMGDRGQNDHVMLIRRSAAGNAEAN